MNRKSLIICLAALAVMILGIGIAVAFLYAGTGGGGKKDEVPDQERFLLLPAVPADAVFVACMSDTEDAAFMLPSGIPDVSVRTAISLHYNGDLQALYVFDAGPASSEPSEDAAALMGYARENGMYSDYVDCSEETELKRDISRRSLVIMSRYETLVKSSRRHLEESISIMDAGGFVEASSKIGGSDVMFFANAHARTLMDGMFSRKYASNHPFVASLSQWTVADLSKADESGVYMNLCPVFENDPSEYMTVLSKSEPGISKISRMLPSYTISAVTMPTKDAKSYVSAYQSYMDSKQALQSYRRNQKAVAGKSGLNPEEFVRALDLKEVAKASFVSGGKLEEVVMMRVGREDTLLFVGMQNKSFKDYVPDTHSWPYASYAASVFGKYFSAKDESCFTYMNGWIIAGSVNAVEDYVKGRALSYTLQEYMADAGQKDMLSSSDASMVVYHSFTEYPEGGKNILSEPFIKILEPFHSECDYCPMVMTMYRGKSGMKVNVQMPKLTMMRTKAPEFVRDTIVTVPEGPFRVKNSGTGKMNLFYQNSHGSICLKEEGGKDLWGVLFKDKLCGTAYNVDYYANGKLQIIFGAGSKIYIIDRLGNYVNGFPLDLGKDILLGPDLYDFNGTRAYNIMVLHKDNTIEMYNLKGRKPASWKTITAPETIKALPERLEVGGSTFWVVRTAIQTLIYPFSGGAAVTVFKGDEMIRPDSRIETVDGTSVKAECYDGRTRTVRLK